MPVVVNVTDLSTDVLALVLGQLGRGHGRARDIARPAVVNKAFRDAARIAEQAHRRVCYEGHGSRVTCVAVALVALPDNQHALSGSNDSTIKLFNVHDGGVLRTFTHHTDTVSSLALLPDGLRFVSGSCDGTARITELGLPR